MSLFDRVLILGGSGMLAHALKLELSAFTAGVHAPGRAELDVTDPAALRRTFDAINPTLVLNCAAHTKVDLCDFQRDLAYDVNARAAGRAAGLAATRGARFVHYSTDFVFSGRPPRASGWREDDAPAPQSEYGRSKLEGELAVRAASADALIFRTSWLYGPGGACFPATMVRAARSSPPGQPRALSVVADQYGSPTFTFDLARATVAALRGVTPGGVYHCSNAGETSWHGFTKQIMAAFELPNEVQPITSADWKARVPWSTRRPECSTLDCGKLAAVVGVPARAWQEALKEYRSLNCV